MLAMYQRLKVNTIITNTCRGDTAEMDDNIRSVCCQKVALYQRVIQMISDDITRLP